MDQLNDIKLWRFWGRWKMSIFLNSPYNYYRNSAVYKKFNLPEEFTASALNVDGYVYSLEKDHDVFNSFVQKNFNEENGWFESYFNVCEEILSKANSLERNLNIESCMRSFEEIACSTMIVHFCDRGLETLIPEVTEKSGLSSAQFVKLLVPYKPTYTMQYKAALQNLQKADHENFLQKYAWIGGSFLSGKRLTEEDIIKDQSGTSSADSHLITSDQNLLDELDSKIKRRVLILQKLIYYRSANAEVANKVINLHWEQLDELAQKINLTREKLSLLNPNEIITLLKTLVLPEDFTSRSDRYGIYCLQGNFKIFFGAELDERLVVFEQKAILNQTEVKGTIAFRGKVTGIAKIVENTGDLQKVNEGDIIISPETMPDYIIGMKKAAAFVTNMGGITSHAAIVARELKKPCVIATKFATKVFKDGDMVEVDAEKGVVKKIS